MEVILNLFTKYLQVGETWNGCRAMVFKGIEDLFLGTDIEIDSNVCKIRTSSTKEKTYICTQLHQVRSHQNTRTDDPRENLICMRNCFHQQLRKSTQQCWSCGSVIPTDSSVCNKYLSNNPIIEHVINRNRKRSTQRCESKDATIYKETYLGIEVRSRFSCLLWWWIQLGVGSIIEKNVDHWKPWIFFSIVESPWIYLF